MKTCPYCAEQIQNDAIKCRYCGEFLDGRARPSAPAQLPLNIPSMGPGLYAYSYSYEYRSSIEFFGLPLIHITRGIDPQTGLPRVARGIIAIGNIAIGVLALGGVALGGVTFGGFSLGMISIGGLSIGLLLALGGGAFGGVFAMGGAAVSLGLAVGGLAIAPYALGGGAINLEALRWFSLDPNLFGPFGPSGR